MKTVAVLCATVVAAAVLIGSSAASATTTVSIAGCYFGQGGQQTVPAGSDIAFRFSWITRNAALTARLLSVQTSTATLNGSPIANAASYWSAPYYDAGFSAWRTDWIYDTGTTLAAPGDSVTVTFNSYFSKTVTDGFSKKDGGGPLKGDQGTFSCTVTAT